MLEKIGTPWFELLQPKHPNVPLIFPPPRRWWLDVQSFKRRGRPACLHWDSMITVSPAVTKDETGVPRWLVFPSPPCLPGYGSSPGRDPHCSVGTFPSARTCSAEVGPGVISMVNGRYQRLGFPEAQNPIISFSFSSLFAPILGAFLLQGSESSVLRGRRQREIISSSALADRTGFIIA